MRYKPFVRYTVVAQGFKNLLVRVMYRILEVLRREHLSALI